MQKFRENKHKFIQGEEGSTLRMGHASENGKRLTQSSRPDGRVQSRRGRSTNPEMSPARRRFIRAKWRMVFRRIITVMRAVETMQNELKYKKMKGEVEPSPLLSIVSELSKEACFLTGETVGGGLLGVKRSKRPGHSDHAPVLLGGIDIERGAASARSGSHGSTTFSFSTDLLGNTIQSAIIPTLAKKPYARTDEELRTVTHIIKGLHFFEVLPSGHIIELLRSAKIVSLAAGDILYKRGNDAGFPYCILSGALSVIVRYGGLNFTACDLYSGTTVGEQAAESGKPQVNTVMATRDSLLLELPSYLSVLNKMKAQDLEIKVNFLKNVTVLSSILSDQDLTELSEHMSAVRVKEATRICSAGSPIRHLLFVKSGQLRTLKVLTPVSRRGGRRFVVEVQTLSPMDIFGMNAFCHMHFHHQPSTRRNRRRAKASTDMAEEPYRGSYLGHLVSNTYCELYQIPIEKVQSILMKEHIKVLSAYGEMMNSLYNSDDLSKQLDSSLDWRRKRGEVVDNAIRDWRALQGR